MTTRWQLARLHEESATGEEFSRMGAWLNRMARVFDVDGVISGTAPTASSGGFLMIPGAHAGTTDGAGNLAITFPTPFPNGLVTILCGYPPALQSITGFTAATGAATTPVVVQYLAVGW